METNKIHKQLSAETRRSFDEIQFLDEIDSTNAEALRQIQSGKTGNWVILANSQSAGRGRRGRHWVSPASAGIYLSVVRQFTLAADALQALSLVTALSVQQSLSSLGVLGLQLKWPNDLLHQKQKLAGILLELHQGEPANHVVFGVGVNLAIPEDSKRQIERPVTDISSISDSVLDSSTIVAAILEQLCINLQVYETEGFKPFVDSWNAKDCYLNADIVIQNGERRTIGRSLGVDESGALIMQTAVGRQVVNGGEIFPTLRELADETKL